MNAIKKIYERFPKIEKKVENPNDPQISLTNQEAVFYQLAQFFMKPETFQFSLNMIYDYLRDESLLFAIEVIIEFFQKDTTLVKDVEQTYYDSALLKEKIVGQKEFARMVEEGIEGVKFKPSMVHIYWHRQSGRIPNSDLIIDGTPYWKKGTVESFIEKEKEYREAKKRKNMGKEK
ncbi:hypothetical protein G3M81_22845 [Bacillus paralicheniformis]|uniref:hypothetical protein n=1 Tax=Bacillus TaxID=1386 RepID=UPI0013EECC51|nr:MULTISPECIES: hypothetical protein [Bacillus]QII26931.1 hypothetical protein G3M80_20755 [Bacillus altitudinis]QII51399.1 hypothetical protein G3M81_22845 [Bacillus paralicheniformis]